MRKQYNIGIGEMKAQGLHAPLPRRGGGGVERGGDACIALGGAVFAFHTRFELEPR